MKRQEVIFASTSLFVGILLLILTAGFYLYTEEHNLGWFTLYTHPLREYCLIFGGVGLTLVLLGLFYRTSEGFFIVAIMGGYENLRGHKEHEHEKRLQFCTACGNQRFKREKFCPVCGELLEEKS